MNELNQGSAKSNKRIWYAVGTCLIAAGYLANVSSKGTRFQLLRDQLLPSFAFFLFFGGTFAIAFLLMQQREWLPSRWSPAFALIIALCLSSVHFVWSAARQFALTGADRHGQCEGLIKAGAATDEIPASSVMPRHPTIGCAQEIRGMFLSPYYEIQVYGVTRGEAQEKIIRALNNHRISFNTFPLRVEFFDSDYWIYRTQGNLAIRQKGPGKQLRLVFLDDWLTEAVLRPIARASRNSNGLRQ